MQLGAHRDGAQRGPQHAALVDRGTGQAQRAEDRIRRGGECIPHPLDVQHAGRIEGADGAAPLVDTVDLPDQDPAAVQHGRVDLRGGQRQVARLVQQRGAGHADVRGAAQRHLVERIALHLERIDGVLDDLAARANAQLAHDVEELRIGQEAGAVRHQRHTERAARRAGILGAAHRVRHDAVFALAARGAGEAHIGRRQADTRAGRSLFGQADGAGRQAQALAHGQVHVAIEADQAVGKQRQIVEAARRHAVHAHAGGAVAQRGVAHAGAQRVGKAAIALHLRHHQFTRHAHCVVHRRALQGVAVHAEVGRRLQVDRQRAAGRARATGGRTQVAIHEQAAHGTERDHPAVAGHVDRADAGHVHHGRRPGGVQPRTGPHHHEGIGRIDLPCAVHVARADLDGAAVGDLAIGPALHVTRGDRTACHVDHGIAADPDRAGVGRAAG
ncbi:hypothetical protein D3C87_1092460 [compost metagenome]